MVADGNNGGISLFAKFIIDVDSELSGTMPELLIDEDSSSNNDSMPSLVEHEISDKDNDDSYLAALMAHDNESDEDS